MCNAAQIVIDYLYFSAIIDLMGRTVTFKIYRTVEEADLAQQFLTDHDIPSSIQVDEISGGVRLLIDENDLAKAQELLLQ